MKKIILTLLWVISIIQLVGAQELTAEDYELLTPEEQLQRWEVLSPEEQARFLERNGVEGRVGGSLAHEHFESAERVNANTELFSEYMQGQEVDIEFVEGSEITTYSNDGFLAALNGQINVLQFRDQYQFRVNERNELVLIDIHGLEHTFEGILRQDANGLLSGENVRIDGTLINGEGITFDADEFSSKIRVQKAFSINGIEFKEGTPVVFDTVTKQTFASNAVITTIPQGTSLGGENVELPFGNKLVRGQIIFRHLENILMREGSVLETVNKERITATQDNMNLYLNDPDFNPNEHKDENYVYSLRGKAFDIHTIDGGKIDTSILPGNELFNTFRREYLTNERIIVPKSLTDQQRDAVIERYEFILQQEQAQLRPLSEDQIAFLASIDIYGLRGPYRTQETEIQKEFFEQRDERLGELFGRKLHLENQIIQLQQERSQARDRWLDLIDDRNTVPRDEFDKFNAIVSRVREENNALGSRIHSLGKNLASVNKEIAETEESLPDEYLFRNPSSSFIPYSDQEGYIADQNGNAYRIVEDTKDSLHFSVENGDAINTRSREKQTAKTEYISNNENGRTVIRNGRNTLQIENGEVSRIAEVATFVNGNSFSSRRILAEMKNAPYQSVGMRIEDSFSPVVFDYYNRFESKDGRFRLNSLGFSLSESSDQINMQTPEDLSSRLGLEVNLANMDSAMPNTIDLLNRWFHNDPQKKEIYSGGITISDAFRAANSGHFGGRNTLIVGERLFDPYTFSTVPIRNIKTVLEVLDHEFTHGWENRLEYHHQYRDYSPQEWLELGMPRETALNLDWSERGLSLHDLEKRGVASSFLNQFQEPKGIINDIVMKQYIPLLNQPEFREAMESFTVAAIKDRGYLSFWSETSRDLVATLNKHYEAAGLNPISTNFMEVYLQQSTDLTEDQIERRRQFLIKIDKLDATSKNLGNFFNPEAENPSMAAVFATNKFISTFGHHINGVPTYYQEYRTSFKTIEDTRESLGFFPHSLDTGHASILGIGLPPDEFPEVTSIFVEQPDHEIISSLARQDGQGEMSRQLLQYMYDIGRIEQSRFERLRGSPCSRQNPCERGVLWKFGKFYEQRVPASP